MGTKTWLLMALVLGSFVFSGIALGATDSIVFVLDASNSMNNPLGGGSRIDAAKDALVQVWEKLPDGTNVGLFVFGHRLVKTDRKASCGDIELLFPIQSLDDQMISTMISSIYALEAKGLTPLADVLVEASEALSSASGDRTVILVSDGEETCEGDPIVVARMLASMSPPIVLHVIGLDVDPAVREELTGMAESTGGSYYHVSQSQDLLKALTAATTAEPAKSEIPPEYAALGITNVIYGTDGNDRLYGTPENDLILGLAGDDFIMGLDGNDILIGGEGNDIIEGGNGCDIICGGPGDDILFGGNGDDHLCGDCGNDSLEGEAGNDVLCGGPGVDKLLGGSGLNILYTDGVDDTLWQGKIVYGSCVPCLPACPLTTAACPKPAMPAPPPVPQPCGKVLKSVDEGSSIQLHGTANDEDCNVVSVQWSAELGSLDDPTSLDPIYTAPMTDCCEGIDVCITLVATDSCGAEGRDSFVLHINNINLDPTVDAGSNVIVDEGKSVQLCASASDPDGGPLRYRWTVPVGKGALSDPTILNPVYRAPMTQPCEGEYVVLRLAVTDSCGATVEDTVTVNVRNLNQPPRVELGPGLSMKEGSSRVLQADATDPECGKLSYYWTTSGGSFDDAFSPTPCFTAPQVDACQGENITVSLTVTDECGAIACDSYVIHIENINRPPVVEADP
jgi:hypothetical protein